MEKKTPLGSGARIAYVSKLIKETPGKAHGTVKRRRRLTVILGRDSRFHLKVLRPLVMYEGLISHSWGETELAYPQILITLQGNLVRGVLHGDSIHFSAIAISELTDNEIQRLTKSIRGEDGLKAYLENYPVQ